MNNKEIKSPVCPGWMSGLHANIFYAAKYSTPSSLKIFVETVHFPADLLCVGIDRLSGYSAFAKAEKRITVVDGYTVLRDGEKTHKIKRGVES